MGPMRWISGIAWQAMDSHAPQVAGPVIGAREGGVGGFFAGLGAGLATLAIAPVVGVGVGVRQALPIPSCV